MSQDNHDIFDPVIARELVTVRARTLLDRLQAIHDDLDRGNVPGARQLLGRLIAEVKAGSAGG